MTTTNSSDSVLNGIDTHQLAQTIDAVRQQPELAQVTFELDSNWVDGCHQVASTGNLRQNGTSIDGKTSRYTLESDEPAALLGTDKAASPGEYVLQALAGCYAVTFATNAALRGIKLTSLKLEMEADFDLQGFLGLNEKVRSGAQEIRIIVHAGAANATQAQLADLSDAVQQRSPIRDTLVNAVTVTTTLAPL